MISASPKPPRKSPSRVLPRCGTTTKTPLTIGCNNGAFFRRCGVGVIPVYRQSGTKKRPAVIVSNSAYKTGRRDLVIMAITSQVRMPLGFGEALVTDWQAAGLIKPSVLKPVVTTIEQGFVVRIMGAFSTTDLRELRETIAQFID